MALQRGVLWMVVILVLVSSSPYHVQATPPVATALESLPFRQVLNIPFETSQEGAAFLPVDQRVTFTNPCWGRNETVHSIRVGMDDGSGLQELESQVYDLKHTDDTHLEACSLVFLIPAEATGKEQYFVAYDSQETEPAQYTAHVTVEDTHYFYEPIPGQTIDFDYFGIRQDGFVVYTIVQKGQLLGNPVGLSAIKFKPNSTTVETFNLDQLGNFDFRYGATGEPDYVGTSWSTEVTKTVLVSGPLMARVRLACTSPRADIRSDNIYTYYYNPTATKRLMVDASHEILKAVTIDDPSVVDGNYASIVSIKARSASIEKMNVGEILPTVFISALDGSVQEFTVPTNPQSTTRELVVAPQDALVLSPQGWVCLEDTASGKIHGLVLSNTTGITNGTEDGVQVKVYAKQNIKLPGLEADTGSLDLSRKTAESGTRGALAQGTTYRYALEFLTDESGGHGVMEQESARYQRLSRDVPVFRGNATEGDGEGQRFSLTAFVSLARSVPLGSLLSAALGRNISYIYAELYQQETFRSSGSVGRLALGSLTLDLSNTTLREKVRMILGIFDLRNSSLVKKIRFPNLDPGTYIVKVYRENPRFATERQFIAVAVVDLSADTVVRIRARPQGSATVRLVDQQGSGVPNARCALRLGNATIAEAVTDANGSALLAAPCSLLRPYRLTVQYQGFLIGDQDLRLGRLRRLFPVRTSLSLDRYSLGLSVTDTWGFAPAVTLNPSLTSTDQATATVLRGIQTTDGEFSFSDLPPATYRLTLGYKTFKVEENLTVEQDTTEEIRFPAEFPVALSLYDATAGRLGGGTVSFHRGEKSKTVSVSGDGTAQIQLPPGDYEVLVDAAGQVISRQQVQVRGDKTMDLVTTHGSLLHLALTVLGIVVILGALGFLLWKRSVAAGLKGIAVGLLLVAVASPWWVLHGEAGTVSTTTNAYVVPARLVTLTQSSNATGGEIGVVPPEVTMVLGLLAVLAGVAAVLLVASILASVRLRRTGILLSILGFVVVLLTVVLFYVVFAQLTDVGVGSVMGSGPLDVAVPGGMQVEDVPSSWGLGTGWYVAVLAAVLAAVAFATPRISSVLVRRRRRT